MLRHLLCATDRGGMSPKVYRHAAGLSAAAGARLALVHVSGHPDRDSLAARVGEEYLSALPYAGDYECQPPVHVVGGETPHGILAAARTCSADLIVCGSRGRGPLTSLLLGSTTRRLLEITTIPVLLVPDTDVDVVTPEVGYPKLHFGSVIAAIDRTEANRAQLTWASALADLARQPLLLMTVLEPGDRTSKGDAAAILRERGHGLEPVRPDSLIVRRGEVAQEISRCCAAERAGLVVMGLRPKTRGRRPGAIATSVLELGRAAVVAVPDCSR